MAIKATIKVNLALFTAVALWSLSFVAIRIALISYSPGSIALLRFFVASLCLLLVFIKSSEHRPMTRQHFRLLVGVGAIGLASYSVLLNSGERIISSGLASFVIAQTPVVTAVLAMAFLKERPSFMTMCGMSVSIFGMMIIVLGETIQVDINLGLMLVMLATVCGSLHSILQKYLLKDLSPYQVTAYSTWFATLSLLIFFPKLMIDLKDASLKATAAVIFLGIVPSTIGQWLWTYGLSRTLVVKASAYLYAMPIISTVCGWLILSEFPTSSALTGGLIALIGAMLVKKDLPEDRSLPQISRHIKHDQP
jgi:drug/metabolite transporter (DMT)-like permease